MFSAGIVFLCEELRYAHIIRERPGLWREAPGVTRPCNVPPMFQQPFRPPFFFLQGIVNTSEHGFV